MLNDYSPEDEENPGPYQAAAPQYNFDTPGRLVIPGEEIPNFFMRFNVNVQSTIITSIEG